MNPKTVKYSILEGTNDSESPEKILVGVKFDMREDTDNELTLRMKESEYSPVKETMVGYISGVNIFHGMYRTSTLRLLYHPCHLDKVDQLDDRKITIPPEEVSCQ